MSHGFEVPEEFKDAIQSFRQKHPESVGVISDEEIVSHILDKIEQEENRDEKPITEPVASIVFDLMPNSDINIDIFWKDESQETAIEVGKMLYLINAGDLKRFVIDRLNTWKSKVFLDKVFSTWSECIDKEENAVILPSRVLNRDTENHGEKS